MSDADRALVLLLIVVLVVIGAGTILNVRRVRSGREPSPSVIRIQSGALGGVTLASGVIGGLALASLGLWVGVLLAVPVVLIGALIVGGAFQKRG